MSFRGKLQQTGIQSDGNNTLINRGQLGVNDLLFFKTSPVTVTTAGNVTYTADQLTGGLILRDPNGGARSDVTPTAASIISAVKQNKTGSTFQLVIRNTADAAETITLTAGTGVTLSGTMTIAQNNSRIFLVRIDSTTAVTIYSIGTLVH